jgi:EAL domain-containing protein (putative c-di-GMP-specific phosphodiesterase class I)
VLRASPPSPSVSAVPKVPARSRYQAPVSQVTTAAIANFSQASRFIQALKELGCRFALDDFGTGLSSFGYLRHFPVEFLEINGSFVKGVLHDPIDREMVRSINEIGHLTGKQTIAEWAENAEIIEVLRGLGVDYAQGYGVSQPQKVQRAAIA